MTSPQKRQAILERIKFEDHDRRTSIGGSEVAAAMGVHAYKTPYKLFAIKTGLEPQEDLSGRQSVRLGTHMEPVILDEFCRLTGTDRDSLDSERVTLRHPLLPWMTASPDATAKDLTFGVEIKFVGYRMLKGWGQEGSDDIPEMYLAQVAWMAAVTRIPVWFICAAIGTEVRIYKHHLNIRLCRMMLKKARNFWRYNIQRKIAPPVSGHEMDGKSLRRIYSSHGPTIRDATPAERHLLEKQVNLEDAYKTLKVRRDEGRHKIEALIGKDLGISDGIRQATWAVDKRGSRRWGWSKNKGANDDH